MSSASSTNIQERIFTIKDEGTFNNLALEIFHFQYEHNAIYRKYVDLLRIKTKDVTDYQSIPFLPIEFFKTQQIISSESPISTFPLSFKSSGTTGDNTSTHVVLKPDLYQASCVKCFEQFYGSIADWTFLALLPSYLERQDSSLVYMINEFMKISDKEANHFYLYEHELLYDKLQELESKNEKALLIGVSYALLDFCERYSLPLKNCIVMETGGMKGKREELSKASLHERLKDKFHVQMIHSEYGMTELLSQAYSKGDGIYQCPSWMKVVIKEVNDPFTLAKNMQTGRINIIDFANLYSCSFIETADMGKLYDDGKFEVLGRIENSIMRGCNMLID